MGRKGQRNVKHFIVKFSSNSRHSLLFLLGAEENIACAYGFCCLSVLIKQATQELRLSLELSVTNANAGKLLGEQVKSLCGECVAFQQNQLGLGSQMSWDSVEMLCRRVL